MDMAGPGTQLTACWPLLVRQAPLVERLARRRLAQDPRCVQALTILTHALLQQRRKTEAWTAAESALAIAPDDGRALWAMAHAAEACRSPAEALRVLARARRALPESARPDAMAARIHWRSLDYRRMAAAARAGLQLDPTNAALHHLLAVAKLKLGQFRQARIRVATGLGLEPDHAGLLRLLGEDQLRRGDLQAATGTLSAALRRVPDAKDAQRALKRAVRKQNESSQWILRLRAVVEYWAATSQSVWAILIVGVFVVVHMLNLPWYVLGVLGFGLLMFVRRMQAQLGTNEVGREWPHC